MGRRTFAGNASIKPYLSENYKIMGYSAHILTRMADTVKLSGSCSKRTKWRGIRKETDMDEHRRKSYRMILSDLDETLLSNFHVPQINRDAIRKAREKGVKFVTATGRAFNMIPNILREIGTFDEENEYSICFNGGLIVENKGARILHFTQFPKTAGEVLFQEAIRREICVFVFTPDCCYIHNSNDYEVDRKRNQQAPFRVMQENNFSFYDDKKIAKIMIANPGIPNLKRMRQEVLHDYPDLTGKVELSFSSGRYMECTAAGVNKGTGLLWLSDYLGIDPADTIAVGDSYNDVPMIEKAGIGACVASAPDDIKAKADYVCRKDYAEGAVSEVIEKFILS